MSKVFDAIAGMAQEIGQLMVGKKDTEDVIVEIDLDDNDEILLSYANMCLSIPAERIRRLLEANKP